MEIKSWYEDFRENMETGEKLETEKKEALAREAEWRADHERLHVEHDIMHEYANLLMERELRALGDYIIQKYTKQEDAWVIADAVYQHYGRFCLFASRPREAVSWFRKALKNKIPYPYNVWKDLAAAYVETGDYKKADHWIQRYMKHLRKEGYYLKADVEEFARFYVAAEMYERALALLLEAHADGVWYPDTKIILAKAYIGLGEVDKGIEIYEEYLAKMPMDDYAFAELAIIYYQHKDDIVQTEANYLKSIEAASNREDVRGWVHQIYDHLSVVHANKGIWDKTFYYLKQHFLNKYEGIQAEIFEQIIDNMPPVENDDMGFALYHAILDFEQSPLRPGILQQQDTEGMLTDDPSAEVRDAVKTGFDFSKFTDLDESRAN